MSDYMTGFIIGQSMNRSHHHCASFAEKNATHWIPTKK